MKDTPYHLTFGQHPRVGISNLPIAPEILKTLSTESVLMDVYSNLKSRMRVESPTNPQQQSVAVSLEEALNESVGIHTVSGTKKKRSHSTTEETCALTRARKAVREDAVLASSPSPAKTSKGEATCPAPAKLDELDISSIRWMELQNERKGKEIL